MKNYRWVSIKGTIAFDLESDFYEEYDYKLYEQVLCMTALLVLVFSKTLCCGMNAWLQYLLIVWYAWGVEHVIVKMTWSASLWITIYD